MHEVKQPTFPSADIGSQIEIPNNVHSSVMNTFLNILHLNHDDFV